MKFLFCPLVILFTSIAMAAPVPVQNQIKPDPIGKTIIGIHSSDNAKVNSFYPISPFKNAGGRSGDYIKKIGENEVNDLKSLVDTLKLYRPGARVAVTIKRGKQELILMVTLGEEFNKKAKTIDSIDSRLLPEPGFLPLPGPPIILPPQLPVKPNK